MRWSVWFLGLISALLLGLVFVYSGGSLASAEPEMGILPAVYDLRELDYPFPIIDQEACQMGYALAGTEMFQAALWQKENLPLLFSANQAKECTWWELTMDGNPCFSGELVDVINVFSTAGVIPDGCNPLYPGDGLCVEGCEPLYYLTGWQQLSTNQIVLTETIKQALINYGPVYTKINTSLTGFESYEGSGVLYDSANFYEVNHAVLIVGWNDTLNHAGGSGAWIVKNSYGTNWGDDGYGYIAYGSGGIGKESSVITDWIKNNPNENLYFYDKAGFTQQMTLALNDLDGYMMVLYTTQRAELIQQIELWTTDAATVSIWVYDRFSNGQLIDPILSIPEISIPSAGYHHIPVLNPVELGAYDEIAVVAYIHNNTNMFPYALDTKSTYQVGKNWYSDDGEEWITFDPEGFSANFGLRLRTTLPPAPSQPLGFAITNKTQTALWMAWQPLEDGIQGYLLERRNPVTFLWERIAVVSPLVTAYLDAELVADTRYEYRLYAYNLGGLSAPSELSTRTLPYAPAAPTDLKISVLSATKIQIEWTDQSNNESGFRIERQRIGEEWEKINETGANIQAWMDETVLGETMYRYRIFAINAGGDSLPVVSDEIRTLNWPYKIVLPIVLH